MKKKTGMYLAIGIIGIALALIAKFLLQDYLSDSQSGAMIGIGAGLFGYGIAKWCVGLWGAKNPDLMKINEIEEKDERNQLIRSKAQAISGEILHWLLMAGPAGAGRCQPPLARWCAGGSVPRPPGGGPLLHRPYRHDRPGAAPGEARH